MLSKQIRFEGIDERHWANLVRAMDPPAASEQARARSPGLIDRLGPPAAEEEGEPATGAAVILARRGRAVRAFVVEPDQVLPLDRSAIPAVDAAALRALRKARGLSFSVAIDCDELPRLWADVQRRVRLEDDLVAQALSAGRTLQRAIGKGTLLIEPRLIGSIPLPPYELLQATFDRMLPDGRTFLFYLFDGSSVWTSLIARKRGGDIELVATHGAIAEEAPAASVRDAPAIRAAVARRYGPPQIALFLPLSVWRRFVAGDRSAIARAMASRQAALDPCPAWLLALVGAGAVSEVASRSVGLAGRLLSSTPIGGLIGERAGRMVKRIKSPLDALNLDPWELIRWSRLWARRALPFILLEE